MGVFSALCVAGLTVSPVNSAADSGAPRLGLGWANYGQSSRAFSLYDSIRQSGGNALLNEAFDTYFGSSQAVHLGLGTELHDARWGEIGFFMDAGARAQATNPVFPSFEAWTYLGGGVTYARVFYYPNFRLRPYGEVRVGSERFVSKVGSDLIESLKVLSRRQSSFLVALEARRGPDYTEALVSSWSTGRAELGVRDTWHGSDFLHKWVALPRYALEFTPVWVMDGKISLSPCVAVSNRVGCGLFEDAAFEESFFQANGAAGYRDFLGRRGQGLFSTMALRGSWRPREARLWTAVGWNQSAFQGAAGWAWRAWELGLGLRARSTGRAYDEMRSRELRLTLSAAY